MNDYKECILIIEIPMSRLYACFIFNQFSPVKRPEIVFLWLSLGMGYNILYANIRSLDFKEIYLIQESRLRHVAFILMLLMKGGKLKQY